MIQTYNTRIREIKPLVTPRELKSKPSLSLTEDAAEYVHKSRKTIEAILDGTDRRLMVITGPCSVRSSSEAHHYGEKLRELQIKIGDENLFLVMRAYFEKPRTTIGWKGLINDPHLDGSCDMNAGLYEARVLLTELAMMHTPATTEILNEVTPQYLADLLSHASIGARTVESQPHRELASGLSMPVGFKNTTSGCIDKSIDAIEAARHSHTFRGVDEDGVGKIFVTEGNPYCHLILRGSADKPNYDPQSVAIALEKLREAGVRDKIIIDCSHDNSKKDHRNQPMVFRDVMEQRLAGNDSIVGVMLESDIYEGNQSFDARPHKYGVSITDKCMSWETTESLILEANERLSLSPANS